MEGKFTKQLLLCIDSYNSDTATSDAAIYDCDTDSWRNVAPTNHKHIYSAAVTWNGTVVVAGGQNPVTGSVEQFNPKTKSWTPLPDLLVARSGHSLVNVDGVLYIIGGWNGEQVISSVEQYNAETKTWIDKPSLIKARQGLASAFTKRGIVASGGGNGNTMLGSCELYNTATCTWSNIATLNIPRLGHAVAEHNFFVYVFGGIFHDVPRAEIEQYDADANKWTLLKARLSRPRYLLAAASVDSRILILGGAITQKEDKKVTPLDVIDCFDAEKHVCLPRSKLPRASYGLVAASYSESLND